MTCRTAARVAPLAGALPPLLILPAALIFILLRPAPWNESNIHVRFQGVRNEAAGLVFGYSVQNRTGRTGRFVPGMARILLHQAAGRPVAGYPAVHFPVDLPARATQTIEIRLELPSRPLSDFEAHQAAEHWLDNVMADVDGFELVDPAHGLRVIFPVVS